MTEQEKKEIRDFEKIRLKYYLIIQIVCTSIALVAGYICKLDDTTETGFFLSFLTMFCYCAATGCNIYMGMDYLSRQIFKNEWSGELTDEETRNVLCEFILRYDAIFIFFAICHIAMFVWFFIYALITGR